MSALPSVHPSDDLDDQELYPGIRNVPHRQRRASQSHKQSLAADKLPLKTPRELAEQSDTSDAFAFTYTAARHEAQWLLNSLGEFYEGQWIDDVLRLVKGGKEANVYQCAANETATGLHNGFVAAKVYRPRKLRNLKNDHLYREGRTDLDADGRAVNDDGMLHAMAKRTEYGRELLHISWIEHEVKTMEVLHAAGADVPRPLSSANNAILMGFVGDEDGGAPALSSVNLGLKKSPPPVRARGAQPGTDVGQRSDPRRPVGVQHPVLAG
ncbi:MAG: RIO1 family regulatory kinase/ATPase [Chloroflexota bacterium]